MASRFSPSSRLGWASGLPQPNSETEKEKYVLVLSRKLNESIIIDDQIKITIVEIRGDKIRLGIEAPKDVSVHRREVYEAIQRQVLSDNPVEQRTSEGEG